MPRDHSSISYKELISKCSLPHEQLIECFMEVDFQTISPYYRRNFKAKWENSDFYLSELGLAMVEEYERALSSINVEEKTLEITTKSLLIAKIAMVAAIASAVAALLTMLNTIL